MREILFRGKRIDNGAWVEGLPSKGELVFVDNRPEIPWCIKSISNSLYEMQRTDAVIPETICQYTGLNDKNGKRIFEGDIVRIESDGFEMTGYIAFEQGCFQLIDPACDVYECLWYQPDEMTVLDNIHDNPELLEVNNEQV